MRGPEDENNEDECASEEECEIDWDQMPGFDDDNKNDSDDSDLEMLAQVKEEEEIVLYNDFENDLEIPLSSSPSSSSSQDLVDQRVSASTTSTVGSAASASTVGGARNKNKNNNKKNKNINWKHGMVNMEMSWQMQEAAKECNVDLSPATCGSEVCETCRGTGKVPCRGCRGTGYFKLQGMKDFVVCPLCSNHHNAANDNKKNHRPGFETCSSCQGTGWIAEWTLLTSATVGHHAPASSKGGEGGAGDSSSKHNGGNQDRLLP